MRKLISSAAAAGLLFTALAATAPAANAAPITCPGSQTIVKTSSGWECQNNGGNLNNAEDPKNPNAGKDKF